MNWSIKFGFKKSNKGDILRCTVIGNVKSKTIFNALENINEEFQFVEFNDTD